MINRRPGLGNLRLVSFHPLVKGEQNRICAGRDPGEEDLAAIRAARAVILPQGCPQRLYAMARQNCRHVFPNYDARFQYPGKIGQIRLFRETGTPHPATETFASVADYGRSHTAPGGRRLPLVFKFDWGGEGDTVFLVGSAADLQARLAQAARCEATGQSGFLLQEYIASARRSLRVVLIGERLVSYWRTPPSPICFHASVSRGAAVDLHADPDLKQAGERAVAELSRACGINLAGFDVIFDCSDGSPKPLLLEINYFFGRVGLGGSEAFYRILRREIRSWLKGLRVT